MTMRSPCCRIPKDQRRRSKHLMVIYERPSRDYEKGWRLTVSKRAIASRASSRTTLAAATALGASWSSTSPDFGEKGCLDRLAQVKPKVLL